MAFSSSTRNIFINNLSSTKNDSATRKRALGKPALELSCARRASSSSIVHQAARLFAPATRFEASKLKVVFLGEEKEKHPGIIPRIYTVTHCDLTANLTLAISDTINIAQLSGWYNKLQRDDVVADWKKVKEEMSLHVHCHVSGAHPLLELAAEFRYHIFTKELPLVLKAVIYGDSVLFNEHPELMEAQVWVYFHSNLNKYNRIECWGPLKDAARGTLGGHSDSFPSEEEEVHKAWVSPRSIFHALVALLL
ncbi:protein STAY-GREEN homolog, chloroplastic [Magnolia sinica]|uniref:protein STAY-GREEN homolog, chloroplastic n=1 Tax=Magnolia sinica TaxID=86752 RepID=UPI002657CB18|nr:protein STAY-GREEN homolog, chloroplastic [Magnolia sinica]